MPSVAVQTCWSWLEDIAKIATYYRQTGTEDDSQHLSISPKLVEQLNKGRDEKHELNSSPESTANDHCVKDCSSDNSTFAEAVSEPPSTLDVVEDAREDVTNGQQLVETIRQQPDHLLQQYNDNELIQYDKNNSNITAGDNPTQSTTQDTVTPVQPSTVDATTPLILKYSRESEEKPADVQPFTVSQFDHHVNVMADESLMTCEFCGAEISPIHNGDYDSSDSEEDDYCCQDYKLFIELTTSYMEQMVQALQSEQAKRIDVKPGKKLMKKAAEEQAQAKVRSRRLQDRLLRSDSGKLIDPIKILQSASFYTLSKQMKTINFSLSSPKYSNEGWIVRVSSGKHHQAIQQANHRRKRRRDRSSIQTTDSLLPTINFRNDVLNTKFSNKNATIIKTYSNGSIFQVMLPDGTGHCQYPSGNLAIVTSVLYPGLLSYILYEDNPAGAFLGYFDEAGRAYTFYRDHKLKLFFNYSIGKLFEPGGKVRKKWKWKEFCSSKSPSNTSIQINQQFHLKISSQEDIVLTFNSLSHHSKFSVGCKITEPITPPLILSEVSSMLQYYKKIKAEISFLLQSMVDSQRHSTHSNKPTMVLPPLVRTKAKNTKHVTF